MTAATVQFSVIIPTRNRASLVCDTVRSVLAQRHKSFEIIVVDDCSTDDTEAQIRALGQGVRFVRQPEQARVAAARNAGIEHATGEYVAFLDDDDTWFPWTLETYAAVVRQHSRPAFITSNGTTFTQPQELNGLEAGPLDARHFKDYFAYAVNPDRPGWLLPTGAVLRRDVAREIGGFDREFAYYEDEDMWLRAGVAPGFVRIASPLCWGYRSHALSISHRLQMRFENMHRLLGREEQSMYPGGAPRQAERREIVTHLARHLARRAANEGFASEGWKLYRRLFPWNLERSRWKFLSLFPLEAAVGLAKTKMSSRGAVAAAKS